MFVIWGEKVIRGGYSSVMEFTIKDVPGEGASHGAVSSDTYSNCYSGIKGESIKQGLQERGQLRIDTLEILIARRI